MSPDASELNDFATAYLKKSGPTTAKQLYLALRLTFPYLTEDNYADLLEQLRTRGQIDTYDDPQVTSLQGYLTRWERSLWFYASIIASVSAAVAAYAIPSNSPVVILRWALGMLFVLFLPGYVALEALFPAADLNAFDRFALGVGLSLVLDMFSGLALNYTPWGIRLIPILLLLSAVTICLSTFALVRQFETSRRGSRRITIS